MRAQPIPALDVGRLMFRKVVCSILKCVMSKRDLLQRLGVFVNSVKAIMNSMMTKFLVFIHPLSKIFRNREVITFRF